MFFSILGAFAAPLLSAQTPNPPQSDVVFKTEARQVLVDVLVTDKKGHAVPGLTAKDFHILEDGQERPVQSAFMQSEAQQALNPPKEYMVLLFDRMSFREQDTARAAAAQLIAANPSRRAIAILTHQNGATIKVEQNFTSNVPQLTQVLKEAKSDALVPGTQASAYDMRAFVYAIQQLAKELGAIPGRKTLVLLTPGVNMNDDQDRLVKLVVATCNESNVRVYPVNVRDYIERVTPDDSGFGRPSSAPRLQGITPGDDFVLGRLARLTGGLMYLNAGDMAAELQKISREQSDTYLVSYTPAKSGENACHDLQVSVDRKGVAVRSRSQYCAIRTEDPLSGTDTEKKLETAAASATPDTAGASMRAPFFYTAPNTAQVHVAAALPASVVRFENQNGRMHSSVHILGIAYKKDGSIGARFSDELNFDFQTKEEAERFQQQSIRYNSQFESVPGDYDLKLAYGSDEHVGHVQAPVHIDAYDANQLALSDLALCKQFRTVAATSQNIDALLAVARTPLISNGLEFMPSGGNSFRKADAAMLYFEVYQPQTSSAAQSPASFRLKISHADSGKLRLDTGAVSVGPFVRQGSNVVPVSLKVPTGSLSKGTYKIEVQAVDAAGHETNWRTTSFVLED